MTRSSFRWQVAGFLFTCIAGTLLHFFFDFTGQKPLAGLISAVNESIWEHMKLLFYPMLLVSLVQYRHWGKTVPGFWCKILASILLGLVLIPVLYYTYTGILGLSADWFNVTIFFIAAAAAYYFGFRLLEDGRNCPLPAWVCVGVLILISLLFSLFTFWTPKIPFFQDPITGTYGYESVL